MRPHRGVARHDMICVRRQVRGVGGPGVCYPGKSLNSRSSVGAFGGILASIYNQLPNKKSCFYFTDITYL